MSDSQRVNRVLKEAENILKDEMNNPEPSSQKVALGVATIRAAVVALGHTEGDMRVEMFLLLEHTVAMIQQEHSEVH